MAIRRGKIGRRCNGGREVCKYAPAFLPAETNPIRTTDSTFEYVLKQKLGRQNFCLQTWPYREKLKRDDGPPSVSGAPYYCAAFPTEHRTVGTNTENHTEEQ